MEIPQYLSFALGSKIPGVSTNSFSTSKTYFFINIHIKIACMVINFYGPIHNGHFISIFYTIKKEYLFVCITVAKGPCSVKQ